MGTQCQDWARVASASDPARRFKSINNWHFQVHEDKIKRIPGGMSAQAQFDGIMAVGYTDNLQSHHGQVLSKNLLQITIVLRQENTRRRGIRWR
jgi:hypothetical protein